MEIYKSDDETLQQLQVHHVHRLLTSAATEEILRPTAVMNLVPGGCRSSSFWKISGEPLEEGGVEEEEQRNEEASLLLKESKVLPEVAAGIVSVLRPVTLSLDVHCDEDSELSVAVGT